MTYDELLTTEPTVSEATSLEMMVDLLTHPTWRCYSDKTYSGMSSLIDRFLRIHARLPGAVSDEIYGDIPAAVFHYGQEFGTIRGGLFKNGAVVATREPDGTIVRVLWVDDETAEKWGYPDDYVYLPNLV